MTTRKKGHLEIHGGSRKIKVCSSTFYGVNSNFYCGGSKNYYSHRTRTHRNFSSATMNYLSAVFFVYGLKIIDNLQYMTAIFMKRCLNFQCNCNKSI